MANKNLVRLQMNEEIENIPENGPKLIIYQLKKQFLNSFKWSKIPYFGIILIIIELTERFFTFGGPVKNALIYTPCKREQVWRYITYAFLHSTGFEHIRGNIYIQIIFLLPFEILIGSTIVGAIFICGAISGALVQMFAHPHFFLVGASNGNSAIMLSCFIFIFLVCL